MSTIKLSVSCLLPTYNRRAFISRAIDYFLRQDYPQRELVILDDGSDPVGDLIPADERIRYVRLEKRLTLGAKRNLAVEQARGDLLMHWDDDDWYAPHRIRYQVEALQAAGAEVCGLRQMLFHNPAASQTWLYSYPTGGRPWLVGGSLLYTRDFWKYSPFPGLQIGEDTRFVWGHSLDKALVLPDYTFYVAMIHPGNTSPKRVHGAYWQVWNGQLREIMGTDLDQYRRPDEKAAAPKGPISVHPAADDEAKSLDEKRGKGPPQVTVSIPCFNTSKTVPRAVRSILGQTYTNLTLVVVNDGGEPPWQQLEDIEDPRLVRFDLRANHGRYFADAAVLEATRDPYFLIQDSDDWSEPQRLATLLQSLRAAHACGALSAELRHADQRQTRPEMVERYLHLDQALTDRFEHRANHHGLFRTDALRVVGGCYGGFRIGYDTFLINLLLMSGRLAYTHEPLYHRLIRPGSLTTASTTGMSSHTRQEVTQLLRQMYADAYQLYRQYVNGQLELEALCMRLRQIAAQHISPGEQETLQAEAGRLSSLLDNSTGRQGGLPAIEPVTLQENLSTQSLNSLSTLVEDPRLPFPKWSVGRFFARRLAKRLEQTRPRHLLEVGSGSSTVLFAAYAAQSGASFTSLEHDPQYFKQTTRLLRQFGLSTYVDLRLTSLQPFHCTANHKKYPWYATDLAGLFDFVLLDGPPERYGRQAALFALSPLLHEPWEIWLHDGQRAHEKSCVALWSQSLQFEQDFISDDKIGFFSLRNLGRPLALATTQPPDNQNNNHLGITILTGGRLELLKRTIQSFQSHAPELLDQSTVVALVNGLDRGSFAYVSQLPFVNRVLYNTKAVLPIGDAVSLLIKTLLQLAQPSLLLHLEDDWEACLPARDWFKQASLILKTHPEVGQVRLRHTQEKVLPYHMITRQPIQWQAHEGFLLADAAHFTFNPSLIRAIDSSRIYPCRNEFEAQSRFLSTGLASAQLLPGVFQHIGAGRSSRRVTLGR